MIRSSTNLSPRTIRSDVFSVRDVKGEAHDLNFANNDVKRIAMAVGDIAQCVPTVMCRKCDSSMSDGTASNKRGDS